MEHPAITFLRALDPSEGAKFNIECYTDVLKGAEKPRPDPLARNFAALSLENVKNLLHRLGVLNRKGAGIFVSVNAFDGRRKAENLARVRGAHADLDGVSAAQVQALRSALEPTIVVQSSGESNLHFYWFLIDGEELTEELALKINKVLVGFGADPAATDLTRLLRLPGFRHMKNANREVQDA